MVPSREIWINRHSGRVSDTGIQKIRKRLLREPYLLDTPKLMPQQ